MKAVILARISDKEQEEGHSIVAQEDRLREYCRRKGFTVAKVFTIIESSTRGDRRDFHEVLTFIKAQKEMIALVADAVDRVQRGFTETPLLDELIKAQVLELHFYREGMVIGRNASATDIMRWDFGVIAAKSYVLQLSENVKRSLDWKLRNGQCIRPAPIGYNNIRIDGKSMVEKDPLKAPIITRLFEEYATGLYTLGDMVHKARAYGLTTRQGRAIQKSSIHLLFNNPFYYGEMEARGQRYPHNYQPLVSRSLWDACQDVMNGWAKRPFKYSGKEFVFRGHLRCAVTGQAVWADTKKKTLASGKESEWTYLVATDPGRITKKVWVREDDVIQQVKDALHTLYIPEPVFREVVTSLRTVTDAEQKFHQDQLRRIETDQKIVNIKLDRLTDLLLDESITPQEHKRKRNELTRRQAELVEELQIYQKADDSFRASLELLITLASRASEAFERGNLLEKRQIMNCIFSNLSLRGKKLEYTMALPFSEWPKKPSVVEWLPLLDGFRTNPTVRGAILSFKKAA